jgi:hypothetical protein
LTNRVSNIISDETLNRGIQIESAGKPNAKASTSTATGLDQFLNQSWLEILHRHGPENIARRIKYNPKARVPYTVPDGGERAILDMRKAEGRPDLLKLNIDMLARLWEDNARAIGKAFTDGDLYLAHFAGVGTASRLARSDQSGLASDIFGKKATNANRSIIEGKTVAQVRAWAASSMRSRWDKAGRPDWISRYYPKGEVGEPQPAPDDENDKPPVKLDIHEREDDDEPDDAPHSSPPAVGAPDSNGDDVDENPKEVTLPKGTVIRGDTETWWVQFRLQRLNYGPSMLDGKYGGKTSAAIAAFLNDRNEENITPPKSTDEFVAIRPALKREIARAETEGWKRPVTAARKEAAPEVVKEVAPEATPIQRNKTWGIFGFLATTLSAFLQWAGDSISSAWDFFTANKDNIPGAKDPSTVTWLWSKVTSMPAYVWLVMAAAAFLFFALNSSSGLKTIIDKVKSGER